MSDGVDLAAELANIVAALDEAGIPYALCGGLAVAIHGHVRATQDIDLLVLPDDVPRISEIAQTLGFDLAALPMKFGPVEISRQSKLVEGDAIPLDLLHVCDELREAFAGRICVELRGRPLSVVSRSGLATLKLLSGRPQDLADLAALNIDAK